MQVAMPIREFTPEQVSVDINIVHPGDQDLNLIAAAMIIHLSEILRITNCLVSHKFPYLVFKSVIVLIQVAYLLIVSGES